MSRTTTGFTISGSLTTPISIEVPTTSISPPLSSSGLTIVSTYTYLSPFRAFVIAPSGTTTTPLISPGLIAVDTYILTFLSAFSTYVAHTSSEAGSMSHLYLHLKT